MFAISNDELELLPSVNNGDLVVCYCGEPHPITVKDPVGYIKCGNKLFLVAMNGKLLGEHELHSSSRVTE